MAVNRRIAEIILQEVQLVDDRCEGYRNELMEAIYDILDEERRHKIGKTNIQQKINEKCDATGRYLADRRPPEGDSR